MRSQAELLEKHSDAGHRFPPYRMCPNCFRIDNYSHSWNGSHCVECKHFELNPFPLVCSLEASKLLVEAIEDYIKTPCDKDRERALNALNLIHDEWEWKE